MLQQPSSRYFTVVVFSVYPVKNRLAYCSMIALAVVLSGCASEGCNFHMGTFLVDEQTTEREYLALHQLERSPLGFEEPFAIRIDEDTLTRSYSNGSVSSKYRVVLCAGNRLRIRTIEHDEVLVDHTIKRTITGIAVQGPNCAEQPEQCMASIKHGCRSRTGCLSDGEIVQLVELLGLVPRLEWMYYERQQ